MDLSNDSSVLVENRETNQWNNYFCQSNRAALDDKWQELEEYWGAEKYRLQLEVQLQTLSSSLEHQLLYEDYLKKPSEVQEEKNNYIHLTDSSYIVRGEDIKDIPTTYVVKGLEDHELPVIGTYVDKRIVPGFRYRIRLNHTKNHLFKGEALTLKSVGMGYGKRLTFEDKKSDNLLDNYFWSDTYSDGYGFSIIALEEGDKFDIRQTDNGASLGTAEIVDCQEGQRELLMKLNQDGTIEKTIEVGFWVNINSSLCSDSCYRVLGDVLLSKSKNSASAKVIRIYLKDFVLKNCSFYPLQ